MDKIDSKILKKIAEAGKIQVNQLVDLLDDLRSEGTIRNRLNNLGSSGLVFLDRSSEKGKVFASITAKGKRFLGREEHPPESEGSP